MTSERARRSSSLPRQKSSRFNRNSNNINKSPKNFDTSGPPVRKLSHNSTLPRNNCPQNHRGFSLDRKREVKDTVEIEMDPILLDNTPILCNKYVVGKNGGFTGPIPGKGKSTLVSFFLSMLSRLVWSSKACNSFKSLQREERFIRFCFSSFVIISFNYWIQNELKLHNFIENNFIFVSRWTKELCTDMFCNFSVWLVTFFHY